MFDKNLESSFARWDSSQNNEKDEFLPQLLGPNDLENEKDMELVISDTNDEIEHQEFNNTQALNDTPCCNQEQEKQRQSKMKSSKLKTKRLKSHSQPNLKKRK